MQLDIRVPIGLMFVVLGVLLMAWGLIAGAEYRAQSLGININLWWGAVLFVFGGGMLGWSRQARRRETP